MGYCTPKWGTDGNPAYKYQIVPLLRRMFNLERLTLCLTLSQPLPVIDGTCLENDILVYLPRLQTFNFNICIHGFRLDNRFDHLSSKCVESTFIDRRIRQVVCCVERLHFSKVECHVYSVPYTMGKLRSITNIIPDGQFHNVLHLTVCDERSFEHGFFSSIALGFPLLNKLTFSNSVPQKEKRQRQNNNITYPHLTSLNFVVNHEDYVEQLLFDTNTHLPRLTKLEIKYSQLTTMTDNFTNDVMRVNCEKLTRLFLYRNGTIEYPKTFYSYFPLIQSIVTS
jgi:hypothetical protein